MCGIVDANIAHQVFGQNRNEAGKAFYDWIFSGSGHLVVGGKLHNELIRSAGGLEQLFRQLELAGRMTIEDKNDVCGRTEELLREGICCSDDEHVIALAQVSGARLLFTNDGNLQDDFKNNRLIDNPRGKVYSTRINREYNEPKRKLLQQKELCRQR